MKKYDTLHPITMMRNLSRRTYSNFCDRILYGISGELNGTPEEFCELYDFLCYTDINYTKYLPMFRRFIYNHRGDKTLIHKTIPIHHNPSYLFMSNDYTNVYIRMYNLYLNIDENLSIDEKIKLCATHDTPLHMHLHALYLIDIDIAKSAEIFKKNYEENNYSESGHMYAWYISDMDEAKAREIYKDNWLLNNNDRSAHNYATYLQVKKTKDLAHTLYELNWSNNRNSASLHSRAAGLYYGRGVEKNIELAIELLHYNYEHNNHYKSGMLYTDILSKTDTQIAMKTYLDISKNYNVDGEALRCYKRLSEKASC